MNPLETLDTMPGNPIGDAGRPPGERRAWLRMAVFAVAAVVGTIVSLVALAIPTSILSNPLFTRMTPVEPFQAVLWVASSVLLGSLVATYVVPLRAAACSVQKRAGIGGVLSFLAIGCPICNKVVVLVLGISGALKYFAPVQPIIGATSVALLGYGLWLRVRPPGPAPAL